MNRRLRIFAAVMTAAILAACGGHGGSTGVMPSDETPYHGPAALSNFDWAKSDLQGASYQGAALEETLQVSVVLKQRDPQGLVQYAQQVSDPSSPLYRHYITPQQIGQMYGASDQDYRTVAAYFASQGLKIAGWPQHISLFVSGPQANMERAFGTKFGTYVKNGVRFTAPAGTPHFSKVLPVAGVSNLVTYNQMRRHMVLSPPRANANFNLGYSPQQIRKAFDFTGAYNAGYNGAGITVGIIGTGPIDVNRATWCGDNDVAALASLYRSTAANVCEVNVTANGVAAGLTQGGIPTAPPATPNPNGYPSPNPNYFPFSNAFATPPPVTAPGTGCNGGAISALSSFQTPRSPDCNPEDTEAQIDTQQAATLAPGANVQFYLAYNSNDCATFYPNGCVAAPTPPPGPTPTPSPGAPTPTPAPKNLGYPAIGIVEADPEIQEAIALNQADVLSVSYGGGEVDNVGASFSANGVGYAPEEFAALAAEGIAVFVSTGDAGDTECSSSTACVSYPAGDPNVTAVGGVNAPLDEAGNITGNLTAWGTTNGGNGGTTSGNWSGSGGGTSTVFSAPLWQQTAISAAKREQPDVSMLADPDTGITVTVNAGFGGQIVTYGGTSVATPQMAAMWALVLQACKASIACTTGGPAGHTYRLGNAAPYLYSIYKGVNLTSPLRAGFTPALPYSQVFYDVVYGENTMYVGGGQYIKGGVAGPGYDLVTGLGVPFARHLIRAVTNL